MAPKIKITRDEIIEAGINLIRADGGDALNARNLALSLGVSTQPIFSNFPTMSALRDELVKKSTEIMNGYIYSSRDGYPPYKACGRGYIEFAQREKELFKFLFFTKQENPKSFEQSGYSDIINTLAERLAITKEKAEKLHLHVWTFVHGIACMTATEYLNFTDGQIDEMLSDVYKAFSSKITSEEN